MPEISTFNLSHVRGSLRLVGLTQAYRSWGFRLCFLYLRNVKGFGWNHKRVYRIYRGLELNLRIKPKKRIVRERPEAEHGPGRSHPADEDCNGRLTFTCGIT